MFKTALNKNIIPHTWKLANIVPIPKPNEDTDMGTSCRPISLLSVIAKTLEKSLFPYITANIPNTPMQHGYKTHHSTVTAVHTLNNTVAKGLNQMAPPAQTITVALDMSKAFDTINIHTLTRIQNPFLTAQSTQIKSVISVPIKDFIHHYPRAVFNDIPRVGAHFYDIPGSGCIFTTYPGQTH